MNVFIDQYRDLYGVEPVCKVLQVAPSAYRRHAARSRNPSLRSNRAKRNEQQMIDIQLVWDTDFQVFGARKIRRQMHRDGHPIARCTVERLMRCLGI